MPELGGPTTQSGILYQNTIAGLYLGRLCLNSGSDADRVVSVRSEATSAVDDVVITYADGSVTYIQAKEAIAPNSGEWQALWRSIARQYCEHAFQRDRDRIELWVGDQQAAYRHLRELAGRASGSISHTEWAERLTQKQVKVIGTISPVLESEGFDPEKIWQLMRRFTIQQWEVSELELRVYREMPPCNLTPITLFRLMRDRVASNARIRKTFTRLDLIRSLRTEHGVVFSDPPLASTPSETPGFIPIDQSALVWFISSRLHNDCLRSERDTVVSAISNTGFIRPWACEHEIPAGNHPYKSTCLHQATNSDGLVLLIDRELTDMCRLEYEAAAQRNRPCYIFVKKEAALDDTARAFLAEQRRSGNNPVTFSDATELKSHLSKALQQDFVEAYRHSMHVRPAVSTLELGGR